MTCGIALGSWWAYYELGWGGWWFWDPVENASFMPWLVGTALIHSLAVTEKRGGFKSWTVLLAIAAFSLSLLGTFLVRSGIIVSVHAFASDPTRGYFILAFLGIVVLAALVLFAFRAPGLDSDAGFRPLSRETFLLLNNVLLVIAAALVFLGTLAPLIADVVGAGKISVGKPWFEIAFSLPMIPLLFLVGIGMHAAWRSQPWAALRRHSAGRRRAIALVAGIALPLVAWGSTRTSCSRSARSPLSGSWRVPSCSPVRAWRRQRGAAALTRSAARNVRRAFRCGRVRIRRDRGVRIQHRIGPGAGPGRRRRVPETTSSRCASCSTWKGPTTSRAKPSLTFAGAANSWARCGRRSASIRYSRAG